MIENTETKGTAKDTAQEGFNQGNNAETPKLIAEADANAKRLEEANAIAKRENDRREALIARERLGGSTSFAKPEAPKKSTPQEYAKAALQGKVLPY